VIYSFRLLLFYTNMLYNFKGTFFPYFSGLTAKFKPQNNSRLKTVLYAAFCNFAKYSFRQFAKVTLANVQKCVEESKKKIFQHTTGHSPMVFSPFGETHIWRNYRRPYILTIFYLQHQKRILILSYCLVKVVK
jgi:hypothetical protein